MTLVDVALYYAQGLGWPVFPASRTAKHEIIKTGKDHAEHASRDPAQLQLWFENEYPDLAIGMPTGKASGVVVIDCDRKHDGEARVRELEAKLGALPRNMVVRTQSGGIHIYARHPGASIRVKSGAGEASPLGRLIGGPGVDVRADGGIVILPPSAGYRWEVALGDFLPLPDAWLAELCAPVRRVLEPVDIGPITYVDAASGAECLEALRALRQRYRRASRAGDNERAELIDRIIEHKPLAQHGERDTIVSRAGYLIGCAMPAIGPSIAEQLAFESLRAIPVKVGESENTEFWRAKFRASYEAGARFRRECEERERLMWLELTASARRMLP